MQKDQILAFNCTDWGGQVGQWFLPALIYGMLWPLASCGNYTELKGEGSRSPQGAFSTSELTFDNIHQRIIQEHCIQCHAGYSDYATVAGRKKQILAVVLQGSMPKNGPPLDGELQALLRSWVDAGAPETAEGGAEEGEVATPQVAATWDSLFQRVIAPKCMGCHNPDGQAHFLDLSTKQDLLAQSNSLLNGLADAENSYFVERLRDPDDPMPPAHSGIERVSEEDIATIIEWIERGLP